MTPQTRREYQAQEFYDAFYRIGRDVAFERMRQNLKFRGDQYTSGCHDFGDWSMVLGEEVGEVHQAMLDVVYPKGDKTIDDVRKELVQTAAVCFAIIERIDDNDPVLTGVPK